VIVILSPFVLLLPFIVNVMAEDVTEPTDMLDMFLLAVNAKVGATALLNCQPVGAANVTTTDHEPLTPPRSGLAPSLIVMVPRAVHFGAVPAEAKLVHIVADAAVVVILAFALIKRLAIIRIDNARLFVVVVANDLEMNVFMLFC
jgi:hypothetical protein